MDRPQSYFTMFGLRICRRNKLSFIRMVAILICFCIMVLWLNIGNSRIEEELESDEMEEFENDPGEPLKIPTEPKTANHITPQKKPIFMKNHIKRIKFDNIKPIENLDTYGDVVDLREMAERLNREQNILNLRKFPTRSKDSIVIIVQVHKRSSYLIKLIDSFRKAKGISDALLIISHDYYASEINNIIRGIDFCQVLQIFFPYSEQLHPDKFPGADPKDCPRDMSRAQAQAMGCNNAEHPDMYGHYREVKFTMTKHHWWWKANRVFDKLESTKNHDGLVLLLEEDHYVAPDFYEVLKKAYHLKKTDTRCNEFACDIVTLGDYKKVENFQSVGSQVLRIQPWRSTENNMGMAFDRETWKKLTECSNMFCTYDDYNWDWTLMKMSSECLQKRLTVLLFRAPRVFHLGTCGLHHNDANCNVQTVLAQTQNVINQNKDVLDPKSLEIEIAHPWTLGHVSQPNGGWGDIRDHELCLSYTKSTN